MILISQLFGGAGTKMNGGFSQLDLFCVNCSNLNSSTGMLPIWKFKTVPCIVTILSCSGSHDGMFTAYIQHLTFPPLPLLSIHHMFNLSMVI